MVCFEVLLNGKRLCTAGVGEYGLISTILTWVKCRPEERIDNERDLRIGEPDLSVGGMIDNEHLLWLEERHLVKIGDEVTIRVIESEAADPPVERYVGKDPEIARRNRYELYKIYKQEFETTGSGGTPIEPADPETARALRRSLYKQLKRELEGD